MPRLYARFLVARAPRAAAGVSLLLPCIVALAGCFMRPMIPPSSPLIAESAETLAPQSNAIGISHSWAQRIFGPEIFTTSSSFRRGIREDFELRADGTAYAVLGDGTNEHRVIYAGRLGVKHRVTEHLALVSGGGGGYSPAAGGFLSVDGGAVIAYEGRRAAPFLALRIFFGAPIRPDSITWRDPDAVEIAPANTLGGSLSTGLGIWIGRNAPPRPRWRFTFAIAALQLYDGRAGLGTVDGDFSAAHESSSLFLGAALIGLEAHFGGATASREPPPPPAEPRSSAPY